MAWSEIVWKCVFSWDGDEHAARMRTIPNRAAALQHINRYLSDVTGIPAAEAEKTGKWKILKLEPITDPAKDTKEAWDAEEERIAGKYPDHTDLAVRIENTKLERGLAEPPPAPPRIDVAPA